MIAQTDLQLDINFGGHDLLGMTASQAGGNESQLGLYDNGLDLATALPSAVREFLWNKYGIRAE